MAHPLACPGIRDLQPHLPACSRFRPAQKPLLSPHHWPSLFLSLFWCLHLSACPLSQGGASWQPAPLAWFPQEKPGEEVGRGLGAVGARLTQALPLHWPPWGRGCCSLCCCSRLWGPQGLSWTPGGGTSARPAGGSCGSLMRGEEDMKKEGLKQEGLGDSLEAVGWLGTERKRFADVGL